MPTDAEKLAQAFADISSGGEAEMVALLAEERSDGIRGLLAPDAEVRFMALDGREVAEHDSAFRGVDGYVAGWLEWLQPYERFRAKLHDLRECPDGRVLLEIDATATLRGSGIELAVEAAALYSFEAGEITCADHYLDLGQARRAAGLEAGA